MYVIDNNSFVKCSIVHEVKIEGSKTVPFMNHLRTYVHKSFNGRRIFQTFRVKVKVVSNKNIIVLNVTDDIILF
jgi:hypothetical protein